MDAKRRPGDLILDRYMPDATPEQREAARRRLYDYARIVMRIVMRTEQERQDPDNSREISGRPRMGP